MQQYDITVRVNLTLEYEDDEGNTLEYVKQDAHNMLEDFDRYYGRGLHGWACDVSGGKAGRINN